MIIIRNCIDKLKEKQLKLESIVRRKEEQERLMNQLKNKNKQRTEQ